MSSWILQYFLNPAFFLPGMALIAAPILIHLINRLRYKRVRFAAMEFLLASQKRNRRRVLIEHLLLLLLRIAMILLIVLTISRLVIDPQQISLFQGAKSHHVVIIDDTASMLDQESEGTVFENAKSILRRLVAEGARRPGSQSLSLMLMSAPDKTVFGFSERVVDDLLLADLTEHFDELVCTHQSADPSVALEAAHRRLANDGASMRQIHILSDFRKADWVDNKGVTAALKEIEQAKIGLNLVRCAANTHENLGITSLGGDLEVAAAGVPVTLTATVKNWGTRQAENVSAAVYVDGVRLPRTVEFQTIAPQQEQTRTFDVLFDTPRNHEVKLILPDDSFAADNERFLAVHVPVENPVLIVDGSPSMEQAQYLSDALAADRSVTGIAPDLRTVEELRRTDLNRYHLIYLVNIGELAPDAVALLGKYVREGGGLVWYLGDAIRPSFYNERLFGSEAGLFPVRLAPAPMLSDSSDSPSALRHLNVGNDSLFTFFRQSEVPILDLVMINLFYPLAAAETAHPNQVEDAVVLATLGNHPLMLRHHLGEGSIFTCLTSAGPLTNPEGVSWNNWANGPGGFSFVVFQLELAKQMMRKDRVAPQLETGTPIELTLSQVQHSPEVEIVAPANQVTRLQASRPEETDVPVEENSAGSTALQAIYRETDLPGIYSTTLTRQDQQREQTYYALNVPPVEGALELAENNDLLRELGDETKAVIQPAGSFEWIRNESPGAEVRWFLLVAFALACLSELALSARLSDQGDS